MTPCRRCGGLLVRAYIRDLDDNRSQWEETWRCVQCGALTDTQIELNKLAARANSFYGRSDKRSRKAARRRKEEGK